MDTIRIEGTIKYCKLNEFNTSNYSFCFIPTAPIDNKAELWIGFNSDALFSYIDNHVGSKIDLSFNRSYSTTMKPYYSLLTLHSHRPETDLELHELEIIKYRQRIHKALSKFFKVKAKPTCGSIAVSKKQFDNLKYYAETTDIDVYVVMAQTEDGITLNQCDWKVKSKTVKSKDIIKYLYYNSTDLNPLYSALCANHFSSVVPRIKSCISTLEFIPKQPETKTVYDTETLRIFDYFSYRDQHRLTIKIGEFLKNEAKHWNLPITPNYAAYVNAIDRKELAAQFHQNFDFIKLINDDYEFKYKPSETTYINDLAYEIDYLIPRRCYRELNPKPNKNIRYVTTDDLEGIRFSLPINYLREHQSLQNQKSLNISLETAIALTTEFLEEQGLEPIQLDSFQQIEKILAHLIHDEDNEAKNLIRYK